MIISISMYESVSNSLDLDLMFILFCNPLLFFPFVVVRRSEVAPR
jgi:hypothetical protein